ncbi:heme peroxidase [Phlyctochytrium arcticum]|nr:heme peroxidase [Phlyctochytrium arcticum]
MSQRTRSPAATVLTAFLLTLVLSISTTLAQSAFRTLDGSDNNLNNPNLGKAGAPFARTLSGFNANTLANGGLPDPREVSNALANISAPIISPRNISELFTYWGEFIATDLSHIIRSTTNSRGGVPNATLPASGMLAINNVSNFTFATAESTPSNPPVPINSVTAFLDGSQIYGVDTATSNSLRSGPKFILADVPGSLGKGVFPPFTNDPNRLADHTVNTNTPPSQPLFRLGLSNGNTHPLLQSFTILFMREHNRYVDQLKQAGSADNDETLFQQARTHVIALLQRITFNEYLPLLLGGNPFPTYAYNPSLDPSIETLFGAVAFRYGHQEVTPHQYYQTSPIEPAKALNLTDVFYNVQPVLDQGIFPFFAGMARHTQFTPSIFVVDNLRNVLFRSRPMDLFAIDIRRAREFGVPTYNQARRLMNLPPATTFADVTKNTTVAGTLTKLYGEVNKLDAIIGGLAEDHSPSTNLGPLFSAIVAYQFTRIRDGDRLWFENLNVLDATHLADIKKTTLRDVILRNTPEFTDTAAAAALLPRQVFQPTSDMSLVGGGTPAGYDFSSSYLDSWYRFSWTIENRGEENEMLHGLLECGGDGWCGLAFGQDMTNADFLVIHPDLTNQGQVLLEERRSVGRYDQPALKTDSSYNTTTKLITRQTTSTKLAELITGKSLPGWYQAEFRRKVSTAKYSDSTSQPILVALYPSAPPAGAPETWFQYHQNNRQTVALNFITGTSESGDVNSPRRNAHALGMALVWGFVFPFGVFWSRYFRHLPGWMTLHIAIQVLGSLVVLVLGALMIFNPAGLGIKTNGPHSYVGIALLLAILFELAFGILNRLRLRHESLKPVARFCAEVHHWLGRLLVVSGFVNVALGILRMFPEKPRSDGVWLAFYVIAAMWLLKFVLAEVFFRQTIRASRPDGPRMSLPGQPLATDKAESLAGRRGLAPTKQVMPTVTPVMAALDTPAATRLGMIDEEKTPQLRPYTWRELDDAVLEGHHLVVGNGRWVYDIRPWLPHHPGGRLILDTVNGTDITIDFFNESDFDGELGVAMSSGPEPFRRALPAQTTKDGRVVLVNTDKPGSFHDEIRISDSDLSRTSGLSHSNSAETLTGSRRNHSDYHGSNHNSTTTNSPNDDDWAPATTLAADEWKAIRKARWTHAHSKFAAQKLVSFIVGEIVPSQSTLTSSSIRSSPSSTTRFFDPYEYRRYAIVAKSLVSGLGSIHPTYKLKFSLLYPFQGLRTKEATRFFPGQCVEIADRVGKKVVTRFYTPINGSPACFEVLVKIYPGGLFGQHLLKRRVGDRQFRVRGPFATPLLNPSSPILPAIQPGYWQTLVIIAGGAGISPALQFIKTYLLPLGKTLKARESYTPTMDDELPLSPGDAIRVQSTGQDGWAVGRNLATEEEGLIPLTLLEPPAGVASRILIINCCSKMDDLGVVAETVMPALLAYPEILTLHHFISQPTDTNDSPVSTQGYIHPTRLTSDILSSLLLPVWNSAHPDSRKAVVCGPAGLEGLAYDVLMEDVGVDKEDVVVLPPDSYHVGLGGY